MSDSLPAGVVGNLIAHDGIDDTAEFSGASRYGNTVAFALISKLVAVGFHRGIESSALVRCRPQSPSKVGGAVFGNRLSFDFELT